MYLIVCVCVNDMRILRKSENMQCIIMKVKKKSMQNNRIVILLCNMYVKSIVLTVLALNKIQKLSITNNILLFYLFLTINIVFCFYLIYHF